MNAPIATAAAGQAKNSWALDLQKEGNDYINTGVADPFVTGIVVFVVSTGLNIIANSVSYFRKRKTGKEAIVDSFSESGKVGLCSVVGIAAGNTVATTGLTLLAPSVLPIAAGVTTTFVIKHFWDKTTARTKIAPEPMPPSGRMKTARIPRAAFSPSAA